MKLCDRHQGFTTAAAILVFLFLLVCCFIFVTLTLLTLTLLALLLREEIERSSRLPRQIINTT